MNFEDVAPIIKVLDGRPDKPLDPAGLASVIGEPENIVAMRLNELEAAGLILRGDLETDAPLVLNAARQYLELHGEVDGDALHFLPVTIDDLHARAALLAGGTVLVDEFRAAISDGDAVDHARNVVPPAFTEAVNEKLALNLFAAAVGLMARLSAGRAAGCLAEEILAVELIENAKLWLRRQADEDELTEAAAKAAEGELRSLFELFEDDDALRMFEMSEPADAAVAGQSDINQQLGVADQRIEAWFKPFGGVASTGYLDERS